MTKCYSKNSRSELTLSAGRYKFIISVLFNKNSNALIFDYVSDSTALGFQVDASRSQSCLLWYTLDTLIDQTLKFQMDLSVDLLFYNFLWFFELAST